ncbi:MAG: efflux RND transporter permease subunit [Bacteroidales bacterium]
MTLKHFIERPILAMVISIVIVLGGIIGLALLPIEQYPDIAPPTIMVSTAYPGASAETVQKSVIAPLEESINGVENMTYMKSSASNAGEVSITIYFKQGTNPDMAAVNVQNRVTQVTGSLPAEVTKIGVTTFKRQTSMLKIISLYSPDGSYDQGFLSNYMKINLQPKIKRVTGVGEFFVLGADYSMRIWMKPDVMAQYKLVPSDITATLAEQNIESATGSFGENSKQTFEYTMKYKGRLTTPEEFGEIVIRALPNGEVLRLKDVARIELGNESYAYVSQTNGKPGAMAMVFQTAGSNATQVIQDIDKLLDQAKATLPPGIEITELMSVNDFLYASMREVIITLLEAILLVILVVYIFLQDLRSTLVPTISIIVALVGTFAFLAFAGFSINLLTLFALVLAIGTVVDDAIIVVEAVQTKFDAGYRSAYQATSDAMSGITSAIITSTLVFMAVFIPVSLMGGTSGTFFTQFGITMAVAVGISAINALTLSPALCALMIKPYLDENGQAKNNFAARFRKAFNAAFNTMIKKYQNGVVLFIRHRWLMWSTLCAAVAILIVLMNTTKTSLVPNEDQGVMFMNITTAAGSSLNQTHEIVNKIQERVETLPQIQTMNSVAGYGMISGSGASNAMIVIKLKHWNERPDKQDAVDAVIGQIQGMTADIKDAQIFTMAPPMITGYGTSNGFELYLQDQTDGSIANFFQNAQTFIMQLNMRPEIAAAYSTYNINFPQWQVDVDAAKCKRAGISPGEVLAALSGYYGGQYVSNFNRFSKVYRVMIQADPQYRLDAESLNNVFVRVNGEMAPISQFVHLTKTYGPQTLDRFNMFPSISVNGTAADGYSSGDAIRAIHEVAATTLPNGYTYEYGGITREENQSGSNTAIIFGICIILIYLILCALYESFLIPFAVILAVPCGLMGSFLFAKAMGLENNIYLQTGLIMLIGLLAKTAILLTEYATERRAAGMTLAQAAVSAAKVRLRPILMTALTMIFGLLPLVFASGVGANGNRSLGVGTIGGMVIGTLALLFLVPALFIVFQYLQEKIHPVKPKQSTKTLEE